MAEAAETTTEAQDEDEQELIASVGDGVAPAIKYDKEEPDDDPDKETPAEDEPAKAGEPSDDKPAADAGADAGSAAASGGSDGDKPVPAAVSPEPARTADKPIVALPDPDAFKDDPIISRLNGAIEKIEKNELIEDYEKDQKIATLLEQRETRAVKLAETAQTQENQFRDAKARELGITRAQLDQAWNESLAETQKTIGRYSHDASMLLLTQKAAGLKKAIPATGAPKAPQKPVAPKAAAPTPITPKGARIAPPAAVVPAPTKPTSDEQELVESVRRELKSGVRV